MKRKLLFIFTFLFISNSSFSQLSLNENAKVSILTCGTAPVTYAMYGHTGIRIQDFTKGLDIVYNYGAFDFSTPNFALRFIKGDLQYFVTSDNYVDFEYNYKLDNRSIYEQELNLTLAQKQQLYNELNASLYSDERFYTYKFIDRNCTTMVVDKINKLLGNEVIKQPETTKSYRDILYPYMSDFYQKLGIQIIFGTKVDEEASRLFLPFEFKKALEKNKQLSKPVKIVFEAQKNETPINYLNSFYSLIAVMMFLLIFGKKKIQVIYFTLAGFLGVFFSLIGLYSLHEEVLWNYNILLFNPLLLVFVWYYLKNNIKNIILFGKINIALLLVYVMYIINKVQLGIVFPIIALHLFWLIRITLENKKKVIDLSYKQ